MKKRKLFLSLILSTCMVLSACSASNTDTAANESGGEKENVEVWVGKVASEVSDWDNNAILKEIEEKTGTDINITWMDPSSFSDQLNAAAASGEFPDIACCTYASRTTLRTWIDGGIIASFEGEIADAAPNVISQYENNESLNEIKIDGKIYFQPVYWGKGNEPNMGIIHVRKDLMEKYGLDEINTYDQFIEYLTKAKADGLQGVTFTANQEFGKNNLSAMLGAYGKPCNGWYRNGENFEHWSVQPEVADALVLWRNLIADGLVSPEVWTSDNDTARAEYVSGKAAALVFNGGGHIGRIQNDMSLIDETYQNMILPALDFGTGTRGYTNEPMYSGFTVIGGSSKNNPVAAAKVINFLVSEEGEQLTAIGIEGRDYVKTGNDYDDVEWLEERFNDGFPTEANDAGAHPLASGIVSWQPMKWQEFAMLYGKDDAYKEWYKAQRENQVKYVVEAYGINSSCAEWDKFASTYEDLYKRATIDAVKASSDEETRQIWNTYIDNFMSQGGEEASKAMNKLLKAQFN